MMKKQPFGIWFNIVVVVLTLVSVIIYGVNVYGEGYFKNASVSGLVAYCVAAVVILSVVIVLAQTKFTGMALVAADIVSGLLRIAVPVLLTLCLVNLISARAEGLGFIYFSNKDVLLEVQTIENMSSATGAIINMVFLGIVAVASMVAAFFRLRKEET